MSPVAVVSSGAGGPSTGHHTREVGENVFHKVGESANESKRIDPRTNEAAFRTQRLEKACRDFEAVFLSQMIRTMNRSVAGDGYFGKGLGSDYYRSLFEEELARSLAERGNMGIGKMLVSQLSKMGDDEPCAKLDEGQERGTSAIPLRRIQGLYRRHSRGGDVTDRVDRFETEIEHSARDQHLPPSLVKGIIAAESGGNMLARSAKGAKGLMQLMDSTCRDLGVSNPFHPVQNIRGGCRYLRELLDRHDDDIDLALAAYNAGPARVDAYGGIPPFVETRDYIRRVHRWEKVFRIGSGELKKKENGSIDK